MSNFRGWYSWGVAAVFVFYLFLLQASTSVMIPDLVQAFSIDTAQMGILSASFFYPYIILQIPMGVLVDRYGARLVLSFSMIGCAFACWIFATAHNVAIAELSRMLMGITTAGGVVAALFLAANWFPLTRFALLAGLTEMLGMLGGAIGQNILAFSTEAIGWRGTMIGCAAMGMLLAVLTIGGVMDGPADIHTPPNRNLFRELKEVLYLPQVWINGVFGGLIFAVITGFGALWAVPFLMKLYGVSLTTAAATSSMIFWGAAIGGPLAGWLGGKLVNHRIVMQIGSLIVFLLCLFLFYGPSIPLAGMFVVMFALGFFSGVYVLIFVVVCEVVPAHLRGIAMGFTNMMCILFGAPIFQPLIGGLLKSQQTQENLTMPFSIHEYHIAFIVLPVGLFIAFMSTFLIREKKHDY